MNMHPAPFRRVVPVHAAIRDQAWGTCAAIVLLSATLALAIQRPHYLHQDVAFLTWTADKVMRGAVFGRDIYDVNPPLSFLIYVPAALLGRLTGLDPAIRLWTVAVASLSMSCLWQTADKPIRLPVTMALGLFFALGFPREFGQREQFTLLLCAPYVAGPAPRRGSALLSGVMAGIGFSLKPHFLIALLLVFLTRRRMRTEEWAIAATGLCYAACLPLLFMPYLTELLPRVAPMYWGSGPNSMTDILAIALPVVACAVVPGLLPGSQSGARGFGMAAIGFALAVILQRKGFAYHFVTAFGFLTLYLAAMLESPGVWPRRAAIVCATFLAVRVAIFAVPWVMDAEHRRATLPALLAEVDKSASFTVLSNYNYPAFPTAILTTTPFLGVSPTNNFMSSVAVSLSGAQADPDGSAASLAVEQAVRELSRHPELVIVETNWSQMAGLDTPFDGLAWLNRDRRFHEFWSHYAPAGRIDRFELYRLR